jgi:hypothetical protein
VVSMRMVTFCDIKPCGLVEIYRYSEEPTVSIIRVYEGNVFFQNADNLFKTTYGHILDDSSVKVRIFFFHTITLCLIKNGLTHSDLMQLSIYHKLIMGPAICLIFLMKV